MKKTQRLEKLADMANEKPLKQKPSEVLGKDAGEFIQIFARRHICSAFFSGVRLKDNDLTKAAMCLIAEQTTPFGLMPTPKTIFEAYKFQKEYKILNSNQEYNLRRLAVEECPKEVYLFDLEEADKETEDDTESFRRNENLRESREYFALQDPFEAWEVSRQRITLRNRINRREDRDLEALAKPNMVIHALKDLNNYPYSPSYFERLAEIIEEYSQNELGMITAKAALALLEQEERRKSRNETPCLSEENKKTIARAAYWGARMNHDLDMQKTSRAYYVKNNLKGATCAALDHRVKDPELGERAIEELLKQENFSFGIRGCYNHSNGDLAYRLCQKYDNPNLLKQVRQRLIDYSPKTALDYGLTNNDKELIRLARKKLGRKIDDIEIKVFQEGPSKKENETNT
ncbi:hypothetical protein A3K73_01305 [Candidatus Pacearchaeota archaeon RBG_13_36_9]|nr:MAG: hypothetical protein A3K73_01305 [Candidatus Pacearchaeota archaeon RBG_13_36_9]HJX50673.1 hypothetical protein [Candidatus Nanoarchaeia archaeon]